MCVHSLCHRDANERAKDRVVYGEQGGGVGEGRVNRVTDRRNEGRNDTLCNFMPSIHPVCCVSCCISSYVCVSSDMLHE